jgi:hypothetical protein
LRLKRSSKVPSKVLKTISSEVIIITVTTTTLIRYRSPEEYSGLDLSPVSPCFLFIQIFLVTRGWWKDP